MSYAEPFVYLRLLGSFGATAGANTEIWGVGLKFRNPGMAPTPANVAAFVESCVPQASAYHSSMSVGAGSNCFLKELTGAYIGTDGKYVGGGAQVTQRSILGTPTVGAGTTVYPWTQAIVVSLRTMLSRGPGSNGRIYYPATAMPIDGPTGVMPAATALGVANAARTMLDAFNAAAEANLPGTGGLSVMSQVSVGVAATVVGIRVGRRMDRQERRENDLDEGYQSATLSAAAALGDPTRHVPIGS